MKDFWNSRYKNPEYAYGVKPNKFFEEELIKSAPGRILLYGEGEGRNAVFASKLGWQTDAVDFSESGKEKAVALAAKNNVDINYILSDLRDFFPTRENYDCISILFLHLTEDIRNKVHRKAVEALDKGGRLILEVFEKDQLKFDSGGPKALDMLYSLEDIYTDFYDLEIEHFSKTQTFLDEGPYHQGEAAVIRFVGTKQ